MVDQNYMHGLICGILNIFSILLTSKLQRSLVKGAKTLLKESNSN